MNLVLEVAYIAFVVYVCWVTLLNVGIKLASQAYRGKTYTVSTGIGAWYILLWTAVFAAPVVYRAVA